MAPWLQFPFSLIHLYLFKIFNETEIEREKIEITAALSNFTPVSGNWELEPKFLYIITCTL